MVVGAFPVVKLGALLMKQLSKPIANFSKERAKNNYFFRTYICMPPAQFYNWCEIKTKMWVLNLGKPVNIPPLNEAMAIELGANMLGETIVFSIAAGILFFEYSRQAQKELAKEQSRQEEISTLNYTIQQLYFQVERQDAQIRELLQSVSSLERGHPFLSRKKKSDADSEKPPPPPPPPLILPSTPLVPGLPQSVQNRQNSPQNPPPPSNKENAKPEKNSSAPENSSIIASALQILEQDFLPRSPKEYKNGLVSRALEYVQEDVFHLSSAYIQTTRY